MRHHRKLTDDERRQIIEARAEGTPAAALSRHFGVSLRTIYNTLRKAERPGPARTRTVSARVSDRELAGFIAALEKRGITDRAAALRRLVGDADHILMPSDQEMIDRLAGWSAEIRTHGAAINQIARKMNEAKLRARPMPYTPEDDATIRVMVVFLFEFIEEFRALWNAKRATITQEVEKALVGLTAKGSDHESGRLTCGARCIPSVANGQLTYGDA